MKEIENFSITQAARLGISAVVRSAADNGYAVLSKNSELVSLVMPLNLVGIQRFHERIVEELSNAKNVPNEIQEILVIYKKLLSNISAEK